MSQRAQKVLIWWGLSFMWLYGLVLWGLIGMMPPPSAALSAEQVAAFYTENSLGILVGATITSWISAFAVPIAVVISVQMARTEKGVPIWSILQFAGGIMMSIFLVLPPLFWGVAAFTPDRFPDATLLFHEFALLTLTTTDQYFIFQMIPIAVIALTTKSEAFPRWLGYFTIWAALVFEAGALAFLTKTGPFSWNGTFVYWFPLIVFGVWISVLSGVLLKAIPRQASSDVI